MRKFVKSKFSDDWVLFNEEGYNCAMAVLDDAEKTLDRIREVIVEASKTTDFKVDDATIKGIFADPMRYLQDKLTTDAVNWAKNANCPPVFLVGLESRVRAGIAPGMGQRVADLKLSLYDQLKRAGYDCELESTDYGMRYGHLVFTSAFKNKIMKSFETVVPQDRIDESATMRTVICNMRKLSRNPHYIASLVLEQFTADPSAPLDGSDLSNDLLLDAMTIEGRKNTTAELGYIGRQLKCTASFIRDTEK